MNGNLEFYGQMKEHLMAQKNLMTISKKTGRNSISTSQKKEKAKSNEQNCKRTRVFGNSIVSSVMLLSQTLMLLLSLCNIKSDETTDANTFLVMLIKEMRK